MSTNIPGFQSFFRFLHHFANDRCQISHNIYKGKEGTSVSQAKVQQ